VIAEQPPLTTPNNDNAFAYLKSLVNRYKGEWLRSKMHGQGAFVDTIVNIVVIIIIIVRQSYFPLGRALGGNIQQQSFTR
jgi:hypothetical protein